MKRLFCLLTLTLTLSLFASPVRSALGGDSQEAPTIVLPYDAEIEYLESTGTQWIDTEMHAEPGMTFLMRVSIIRRASYWYCLFGATRSDTISGFGDSIILRENRNENGIKELRFVDTYYTSNNCAIEYGDILDIECDIDTGTLTVNGVSNSDNANVLKKTAEYPIWLFTCNMAGTCGRMSAMRLMEWAVIKGDKILVNMIPVRFTNEFDETEGAMCDRVSNTLFRNQGTGSFVIGPDL